ncbi:MAG: hypothetical protein SFW35_11015 [Chitinophagales bacterium]|nr:hypothetical protein [Chitinophagales bacterium]
MNKLTNVQLIVILLMVVLAIGGLKLYDRQAVDWNFRSKYYNIDASKLVFLNASNQPERNNWLINANCKSWKTVRYHLPSEASFEVSLTGNQGRVDTAYTDSARTWFFLNSLDTIQGSAFIDKTPEGVFHAPEYSLELIDTTGKSIVVDCSVRSGIYFMRSTQNPDNVFDGKVDSLFYKVFVAKRRFFPLPN